MEIFLAIMCFMIIPVLFIIGMVKPERLIPARFKMKRKRLILFLACVVLFLGCAIAGGAIIESNMTPEEKLAAATRAEQKRAERQQQQALQDSLQAVQREQPTDTVITENEIAALGPTFRDTKKGDFVGNGSTFTIEVLKVKDKKGVANIAERGYGKYRYFTVKITNNTKNAKGIYRRDFCLVSETGEMYRSNNTQAVISFFTTLRRDAFGTGAELAPKVPAKGVLAFEIPEGKIKYKLIYQGY